MPRWQGRFRVGGILCQAPLVTTLCPLLLLSVVVFGGGVYWKYPFTYLRGLFFDFKAFLKSFIGIIWNFWKIWEYNFTIFLQNGCFLEMPFFKKKLFCIFVEINLDIEMPFTFGEGGVKVHEGSWSFCTQCWCNISQNFLQRQRQHLVKLLTFYLSFSMLNIHSKKYNKLSINLQRNIHVYMELILNTYIKVIFYQIFLLKSCITVPVCYKVISSKVSYPLHVPVVQLLILCVIHVHWRIFLYIWTSHPSSV